MTERRRLRPPEPPPKRRGWALTAMVAVAFLAIGVAGSLAITGSQDRLDATAGQAVAASDPVLDLCGDATPVGEALRADPENPCGLAAQVLADPVPDTAAARGGRGDRGETGQPGDGPSAAEIQVAVQAALDADPPADGRPPTTAEVAAAAAAFLTANPPQPGRAPTAGEIGAAVSMFFEANPPRAGADGRAPTADEIRAAVAQFFADNPPPQGDQGVGVVSVRREQGDTGCALVFTFADPATGETTEQTVPVPAAVCDSPDSGGLDGG